MSRIAAPRGSFGYAQDRLFDSAPSAVPRDKSVRRFAQDDDSVGGLKKNTRTPINRVPVFTLSSKAKPGIVCFRMGIEFRQALVVSFLITAADRSCKELDKWASNRETRWHKLLSAVLSPHHAEGNFKFVSSRWNRHFHKRRVRSPRMLRWATLSRRHLVLRALYHSEHLRLLRLL
jgi:hypothetical protein